jgi:signal peptidase II
VLLPLILIIFVIIADQLTKVWIVGHFAIFESRVIIPGLFNLTYLTNKGAAFGLLNGNYGIWRQVFFVAVAFIVFIGLIIALRRLRGQGRIYSFALGLIAGGAIGNLLDRLRLGAVVDFLDFYYHGHHWPAFNVADSAITVGVALLVWQEFMGGRNQESGDR